LKTTNVEFSDPANEIHLPAATKSVVPSKGKNACGKICWPAAAPLSKDVPTATADRHACEFKNRRPMSDADAPDILSASLMVKRPLARSNLASEYKASLDNGGRNSLLINPLDEPKSNLINSMQGMMRRRPSPRLTSMQ
jgi:hypothetical protein